MTGYYDRDLTPIDADTWARLHSQEDYKRVERATSEHPEQHPAGWEVSTVWLGIDHGWDGNIRVFETMVFGGPLDQLTRRYRTERDARKGHMQVVRLCQSTELNMAAMLARHTEDLARIWETATAFVDVYGNSTDLSATDVVTQLVDAFGVHTFTPETS